MFIKFVLNTKSAKLILVMEKSTLKTILVIVKYVITALLGYLGGNGIESVL